MESKILLVELNQVFVSVFEDPEIDISLLSSAKEIHNWNSMNHILLITAIEERFGVSFELDDLIMMNNVADIISVLKSKISV